MDELSVFLGVLAFCAALLAAYVFTVAARKFVSDEDNRTDPDRSSSDGHYQRQGDRRSGDRIVKFPLLVNGIVIPRDRRGAEPQRDINQA